VGRVFDFCNPGWFWVLENFQNQRTVGFGYLKRSQTEQTASSGYFKNFKKLLSFMKALANGYEMGMRSLIVATFIIRTSY
jgi:hypothetical protein